MSNQAQVDALEHMLIALLKRHKMTLSTSGVFEDAHASLMSEDGPHSTTNKTEAVDYLHTLKDRLK